MREAAPMRWSESSYSRTAVQIHSPLGSQTICSVEEILCPAICLIQLRLDLVAAYLHLVHAFPQHVQFLPSVRVPVPPLQRATHLVDLTKRLEELLTAAREPRFDIPLEVFPSHGRALAFRCPAHYALVVV